MHNCDASDLVITGLGVTASIGQGKEAFWSSLLAGDSAFGIMQRPGRQKESTFLGAEIRGLAWPEDLTALSRRAMSFTSQAAVVTLAEAWTEARLNEVDPVRIGLVVGGSNLQQREIVQAHEQFAGRPSFLRPSYAVSFMDTDVCGVCTECFGIRGFAYTVGGSSASGQLAVIRAAQAVANREVDICIALGGLMDLSFWECHSFRSLGVMGSDRFPHAPADACRPYDRDRDGFIYGEACGAVVIERSETAAKRNMSPYAVIRGWSIAMDAHRNPDPSLAGEVTVIQDVLRNSSVSARDIDYVNPHGSGSVVGDAVELQAIHECGLAAAAINATKSITGHALTAAGAVEIVATVLQMRFATLHPSRNMDTPLDASLNWIRERRAPHTIDLALTLSFGFGGVNTSLCLQRASAAGAPSA
jgi:malonyl-ACP decarboxylase